MGFNRAQNTAKNKYVLFSLFFNIFMVFFGGFNYSKMVDFDFQMDCNTFWMISGTSKKSTKSGPSGPLFITKIFQKIQEVWEHP